MTRIGIGGLVTLAGILLIAAVLQAEEPARPAEAGRAPPSAAANGIPQFSVLDVNSDTLISVEEAKAHAALAAIFATCDADRNGVLNTWEFAEARSKLEH